ncbi:MAG TPA: DUF4352 domain-containing protein [Ktedonobacteraceae bacterium]
MQQPPDQPYFQQFGQYQSNQPYPQQPGTYPPNQPYPQQQPGNYPPNQPYNAYPPQQPMQAPQRPKRKGLGLGCGIATAIVVVIVAIAVISASHGGQASISNAGSTQTGQATSVPPTNASHAYNVGQSAPLDGWVVTVNSVKTTQSGAYGSLKAGDTLLELDVSVKNETGSAQVFSSLLSFQLKDTSGQSYNETIVSNVPNAPDGNVANGSPTRGTLAYEVPSSIKSYTLDFTPNLTSTNTATWNINVK